MIYRLIPSLCCSREESTLSNKINEIIDAVNRQEEINSNNEKAIKSLFSQNIKVESGLSNYTTEELLNEIISRSK